MAKGKSKLLLLTVTSLILVGLLIVGCSRSDQGETDSSENYLKVQLSDKDINLDPSGDWFVPSIEVLNIFYDSLYIIDAEGKVKPGLAESMPEINADGKTYKIKIRQDASFIDDPAFKEGKGRSVTSDDVIYSIKRIADPKNETGLWSLINGKIEGLNEFREKLESGTGNFTDEISGLKSLSSSELEIKLTAAFPQILYVLSMPSFSVVAPEAVEKYGEKFKEHPVGTGPFKLISYESEKIVAERNSKHFRNPQNSSQLPKQIVFTLFDDPWNAFKKGELDILLLESRRLHAYLDENFEVKPELSKDGYKVHPIKEAARSFLIFNYNNPLFANVHLRKAISLAIPWKNLIDAEDELSASMIPQAADGFIDAQWEYNPEKAKKELSLGGYKNGENLPTLKFKIRWSSQTFFAGMIEDALEEVNIPVELEFSEIDELENSDMRIHSWVLDYPEASNILELLKSTNLPPDGNNYGYMKNAEYDSLIENQKYQDAAEFLIENALAIPYRQTRIFYALSPRIEAAKTDPLGYFIWPEIEFIEQKND